nr:hypothetical protein [Mycoplasmopsis bovis]
MLIKALELKQLQSFRTEKKLRSFAIKENTTLIRAEKLEKTPKLKISNYRAKSK